MTRGERDLVGRLLLIIDDGSQVVRKELHVGHTGLDTSYAGNRVVGDQLNIFDLACDHRRGVGGLPCEFFDLMGYDRKPPAEFAGPGGFDGRVQSEKIGLLGYCTDKFDDIVDSPGRL